MKTKRVGFDLDGVLIGRPPFVPHWLLQWLFKGGCCKLDYHCPPPGWNRNLRIWSHQPWLRPPIKENINYLQKLAQKDGVELYLVTSRYSFLKKATERILVQWGLSGVFKKVALNENNDSPHLFKEKTIRQLKLNYYFEDDRELVDYLRKKLPKLKVCLVSKDFNCEASGQTLK